MTSTDFRISALPADTFEPLFALTNAELEARGALRVVADACPGYPCRVSLEDAAVGEELILTPFTHHDVASPYRAAGPIYVRRQAAQANLGVNKAPESIRRRLLSFRAYDADGMMVDAEVEQGAELESVLGRFFANEQVAYIHLHNARPGCFACRVDRA